MTHPSAVTTRPPLLTVASGNLPPPGAAVLEAAHGVAQLLQVGQTRPVVVPGQDKLQNKLELVFPCHWRISRVLLRAFLAACFSE